HAFPPRRSPDLVDRDLPPLLLRRGVRGGVPVFHLAGMRDRAGAVEDRLDQRRLPRTAVRQDGDVADVGHLCSLSCDPGAASWRTAREFPGWWSESTTTEASPRPR